MTASSSYNVYHGPFLARLHRSRTGRFMGAWVARIRNANQWLQIALGRPMKLTGIATQGRADANQWVTRYLVAFSQDNMHFEYYMEYGNFKVSRWSQAMTLKYSHHQDFSVSNWRLFYMPKVLSLRLITHKELVGWFWLRHDRIYLIHP